MVTRIGLGEDKLDFNRDVRPILSDKCFHCHGPDKETREGGLRLDIEAEAKRDFGGYFAIVPGDAEASEIFYRITTDDEGDLMPPSKSKREMTDEQKEIIRRWIEEGAEYQDHWSLVSPRHLSKVEVSDPSWVENEVDAFVLKRLDQEGLSPSVEADRGALLRRLSFDLTGLPPSLQELEDFLSDESPGAYEKEVDRLLESPRFGEHWARSWLDLARYADSNGFQADQLRDSWAYRDWVIDAFNANMPYDQFSIEQLAGDLLPNATPDQKIATGFHRTVTCNVEAGVHPEENRTNQIVDRVNTTGTVWLGITMGCVQCHDHKYDPFTMHDYYGMYAFFNNTPLEVENKGGKGVSFDFWGPKMELPVSPEMADQRADLEGEIRALKKERKTLVDASGGREQWEGELREMLKVTPSWSVLEVGSFESTGGEDHRILGDESVLITGKVPDKTVYTIRSIQRGKEHRKVSAIQLEALTHKEIPGKGPGRGDPVRTNFVLNELELSLIRAGTTELVPIELTDAWANFSQVNWHVEGLIDGNRKSGWAIGPKFGESHRAGLKLKEPIALEEGDQLQFTLDHHFGRGRHIGRLRLSAMDGDPVAIGLPEELLTILSKDPEDLTQASQQKLDEYFVELNPEIKKLDARIEKIENELGEVTPPTTLVMVEMEETRDTHIMNRGNYLDLGEQVKATTPEVLPPMDPSLPKNRLGLAKWLMDPDNPLVARVAVNRWWAELFGHGIVKTPEDFGTQGQPPSHPHLLDWLALEFVDSGWSMKHVLKAMVMSATYRQSSVVTPEMLEIDPKNVWYARAPRFRMTAEMVRDNALAVSGMLSTRTMGEPIMPHQPKGIWRQVGRNEPKWIDAQDEDRYRRGVYVIWRRAAPYPSFVNFDAPDRGSCVVTRPRTNTPLQALTTMNDPVYVELSLALAHRLLIEYPEKSVEDRIEHAFELVLSRPPGAEEARHLKEVVQQRLDQASPEKIDLLLKSEGIAFVPDDSVSRAELHAWFYLASILLNLDETITKG
ncbi:MAG: PSD1 and planctomycete cytochrome C domain-containing protein [Verrucomicrobiota bacterium]